MFHLYNFQFAKKGAPQANIRTTANLIVTIAEIITKIRPCNILHYFTAVKNDDFQMKNCDIMFSYLCTKLRFSEAVLTSTHNLCFEAKLRKRCIPL